MRHADDLDLAEFPYIVANLRNQTREVFQTRKELEDYLKQLPIDYKVDESTVRVFVKVFIVQQHSVKDILDGKPLNTAPWTEEQKVDKSTPWTPWPADDHNLYEQRINSNGHRETRPVQNSSK